MKVVIEKLFASAHEYSNLANRSGPIMTDVLLACQGHGLETKDLRRFVKRTTRKRKRRSFSALHLTLILKTRDRPDTCPSAHFKRNARLITRVTLLRRRIRPRTNSTNTPHSPNSLPRSPPKTHLPTYTCSSPVRLSSSYTNPPHPVGIPTQKSRPPLSRKETQNSGTGTGIAEESVDRYGGYDESGGCRAVGAYCELGGGYASQEEVEGYACGSAAAAESTAAACVACAWCSWRECGEVRWLVRLCFAKVAVC